MALSRFRKERWWERKAQAYADLFIALFHVQRSLRIEIARIEEGRTLSEDYSKEIRFHANAGYAEVRKASVMGTFLFSRSTADCLDALVHQFDKQRYNVDFHDELCDDLGEVTIALAKLKDLSRKDLALHNSATLITKWQRVRRGGSDE